MRRIGGGCVVATGQVECRRSFLRRRLERGVWTTRNRERVGEGNDRRGGGVHADRFNAFAPGRDGHAFSFAVR